MSKQTQRIQDLIGLVNSLYPATLAEEWDNVGLQVGDPLADLEKVLVALDPSVEALLAARDAGAQALLTHHPLLFRPLKRLTPGDPVGQILWHAVESGVAIVSAHTNLDSAAGGLNDWLATQLGLEASVALQPAAGDFLKLVVFVPAGHEDEVSQALFNAGAGQIGAYDQCSFRSPGTGTFRPGEGTDPYLGSTGVQEQVEELRLETILPKIRLNRVLEKLFRAHPYEEVAYDLVPLVNQEPVAGMGRIGRLEAKTTLERFARQVKGALGCDHLRVVGEDDRSVQKVAVCGGSGASLLSSAKHQGADLLVTGDIKYHEARQAEELGIALIDAGHFATEQIMVPNLVKTLNALSQERGWQVVFEGYTEEQDPFRVC